jgi:hypothetical protein
MPANNHAPPLLPSPARPESLLNEFLEKYGELMTPTELVRFFRYPSSRAFRRAILSRAFPVPVVRVPGRRGRFALTRDVVSWLQGLKTDYG